MKKALFGCFFVTLALYTQKIDYGLQIQKFADTIQKKIDSTVQGWKDSIDKWKQDILILSDSDQNALTPQIDKLAQAIDKARTDISDQLQKAVATKLKKSPLTNTDIIDIQQNWAGILDKPPLSGLRTQFASLQIAVTSKVQPALAQKTTQETAKKIAAQKAYEKRVQDLLTGLSKVQPALTTAQNAVSQFITLYLQTGVFDAAKMGDIIQKYQSIIPQLAAVYQNLNFSINYTDRTNLVTNAFRRLMMLFLQDISLSITLAIRALKKNPPDPESYYKRLYQLATRLEDQKEGYDKLITALATQYFSSQASQIVSYYHQQDSQMTLNAFVPALKKLASEVTKPDKNHVDYAQAYYQAIMADIPFVSDDKKSQLSTEVNNNIAQIYFHYALTSLDALATAKDRAPLRNTALQAYKAADTFARLADPNQRSFGILAAALETAIKQWADGQTAQKANNTAQAVDLYKQAADNFGKAGDAVDAHDVTTQYNRLLADQFLQQGKKFLNDFLNANRTQLQEYITDISSAPQAVMQIPISVYAPMLQALSTACQKAADAYSGALEPLQAAQQPVDQIDAAVKLLQDFIEGSKKRDDADAVTRNASNENLEHAQNLYQQMLAFYASADKSFVHTSASLIPFYPTQLGLKIFLLPNQQLTFDLLGQRHAAKIYTEVAASLDNKFLAYQYYAKAYQAFGPALSIDMHGYLAQVLQTLQIAKDQIDKMLVDAATKEIAARTLDASAWQPDSTARVYSSVANQLWKEVITAYRAAAQLKYGDAFDRYTRALIEYADAYKANVPQNYFPAIGSAMIRYELMLAYYNAKDAPDSAASLVSVQASLQEFFAQAQELIKAIDDRSQILTATNHGAELVRWKDAASLAINEQQALIGALLPQNMSAPLVLQQEINDKGDATYSLLLNDGTKVLSITITNSDAKFAELFEKVGDAYFDKSDYKTAVQSYSNAKSYFVKLNQTEGITRVDQKLQRAKSYAYVANLLSLVIPNATLTRNIRTIPVAGIQVPEHFETSYFALWIPDMISAQMPLEIATWFSNPDQYKAQLKNMATNFLFPVLAFYIAVARGIDYSSIFNGIQPLNSVSQEGKLVIFDAKRLSDLVIANYNEQFPSVTIGKTQDSTTNKDRYYLAIHYIAIPVYPLSYFSATMPPFGGYPSIFNYQPIIGDTVPGYYNQILALAGPEMPTWAKRRFPTLTAINDTKIVNQITDATPRAYLTAGESFKRRADYLLTGKDIYSVDEITGGTAKIFGIDALMMVKEAIVLKLAKDKIEEVKKKDKKDFAVKLSDYLPTYELFKNYITGPISGGITSQYIESAQYYYKQQNDTSKLNAVDQYTASLFEFMGDAAQLFLIGDPQSGDYFFASPSSDPNTPPQLSGILGDIRTYYLRAIALYNNDAKSDQFFQKTGALFITAGDLVTTKPLDDPLAQAKIIDKKNNYFGALNLYLIGFGAYNSSKTNQQAKDSAALAWIGAVMNGSAQNLVAQANVRKTPVTIVLEDPPESVQLSYEDIIINLYVGDPTATQLASALQSDFLDVLYFLNYLQIALPLITGEQSDADKTAGLDKITKYMADATINLDTVPSITGWMIRPDFKQTFLGPVAQFGKTILATNDTQTRNTYYAAIAAWIAKLYAAFSVVYGHDFLPTKSLLEQQQLIATAIANEQKEIYAPAEQWLGKYGG